MKNNRLITILLFGLVFFLIFKLIYKKKEENAINNSKLTELSFSIDSTFNLGAISSTNERKFIFFIRNIGINTLYIGDIHASCGCTYIKINKKKAAISNSIEVMLKINPENKVGKNLIIATIKANTINRNHQVKIIYNIE